MHQSRPFFSTNTNIFNENIKTSAPSTLNGQNVLISQEQQRKLLDTINTSIMGAPASSGGPAWGNPMMGGFNMQQQNQFKLGNNAPIIAQKHIMPEGVLFTFVVEQQPQTCPCVKGPRSIDQNANTFFPGVPSTPFRQNVTMVPNVQMTTQSKGTTPQTFHVSTETSCSDLLQCKTQVPPSKGHADFSQTAGVDPKLTLRDTAVKSSQYSNRNKNPAALPYVTFPPPPDEQSSNFKKLIIKDRQIVRKHVADVLDEERERESAACKKRVCFADEQPCAKTETGKKQNEQDRCQEKCPKNEQAVQNDREVCDKTSQVSMCKCQECSNKCLKKRKKSPKKKPPKKPKPPKNKQKRKKGDNQTPATSGTDTTDVTDYETSTSQYTSDSCGCSSDTD